MLVPFFTEHTAAQVSTPILEKAKIGVPAPNYVLTGVINSEQQHLRLSDFKGKLLILDFWSFGCASCVGSWPKLMELQQMFKGSIQIITVNPYQTKAQVQAFIKNNDRISGQKMTLPMACGDKQLLQIFPHASVPHLVFIDREGIVKHITSGDFLSKEFIRSILDRKSINVPEKTDQLISLKFNRPLFVNGNVVGQDTGNNLVLSSVITPYNSNIMTIYSFTKANNKAYGWIANYSVKSALRLLYGRFINEFNHIMPVPTARIIFKNKDSSSLVSVLNNIPRYDNKYCYQATSSRDIPIQKIRDKMIVDIETSFGIKARWEKQQMKCLVLAKGRGPLNEYKQGEKEVFIGANNMQFNNISTTELIDGLLNSPGSYNITYPIIDETGYTGKLGLAKFEHRGKIIDYSVFAEELRKHGLELSLQKRETDVIVIRKDN